jgi:sugar/nucleoside kinase (ribokinase family)
MGKVWIVGSVALDTIEGPAGRAEKVLGGSATYASSAAGLFSGAGIIAAVGEDFPPDAMKAMGERGCDLAGLKRLPGKTFTWAGKYAPEFRTRETTHLDLGVFGSFKPSLPGPLPAGDILFLGNIDPDIQLTVLDQAGRDAFVAADTIDHWIRSKRDALVKGLARTRLFFLNDEEARLLTGEENLVRAGEAIRRMGPESVVVKKGEHGSLLFAPGGMCAMPALPLSGVVDPTGAGDSFAGAMLGSMAGQGSTGPEALRLGMARGTVTASFTVEAFGVERLRALNAGEVDGRLARLRELVRF